MSNSKKDSNIIIFHHKRDDRDAFDGRSYLERSRMELNEKGPITLYRERYTLAQTRRYAEEGVAGAQYAMGEIYYFGTGDASDMDIAIDWYTRAAEQGHVDAQFNVHLRRNRIVGMEHDIGPSIEERLDGIGLVSPLLADIRHFHIVAARHLCRPERWHGSYAAGFTHAADVFVCNKLQVSQNQCLFHIFIP